jgi:hypothetical protein
MILDMSTVNQLLAGILSASKCLSNVHIKDVMSFFNSYNGKSDSHNKEITVTASSGATVISHV